MEGLGMETRSPRVHDHHARTGSQRGFSGFTLHGQKDKPGGQTPAAYGVALLNMITMDWEKEQEASLFLLPLLVGATS